MCSSISVSHILQILLVMKNNNMSVLNYFSDLGFYHDKQVLGRSTLQKKYIWTIIIYLLLATGIFARQITQFPKVEINVNNLRWSVFFASMIFGFAILPYVMRRISKNRPNPSIEHTLSAFGIGFFVDFANTQLTTIVGRIF